ncbi:unnamed protein product [Ambrosiozyma monospora]|uniref:Unnamed protein product n=1 Tax=Ambrosiozyma monospora TaxID=43982 RepID=A0ACB5T551_AMBMO|nr:unnamed protein product [Ambrosiozyma monospora]
MLKLKSLPLQLQISDVTSYGTVNTYNKKFELFKNELLKPTSKTTFTTTTSQDPVIKKLVSSGKATVFATDAILAQLMCAARSSNAWDIVVSKKNGVISFDKRDNSEMLDVDENTYNSPNDNNEADINSASKLSAEATAINKDFLAATLENTVHKFEHPENPFSGATPEPLLNRGYKYRKFSIPPNNKDSEEPPLEMIVRCSVDSIQKGKLLSINALNQYNIVPSNDWKTKLGAGPSGVIFAEELKKNNNKISKWITKAMLGGLDLIKIGFVTRHNPKDNTKHVITGALSYTPQVLASQIKLSLNNGWGVVKSLIDIIEHEGGEGDYKFVILKDPNAQKLNIYKVPLDAFE